MIVELFAIFDAAAERYIDPFCAPTVAFATRGFQEACSRDGNQFQKFPEDYTMYHVGTFNAETGELIGHEGRKVAMAMSFVNKEV